MENLTNIGVNDLVDMLAYHTDRFSMMKSEGAEARDYDECRLIIHFLQKEIEYRKMRTSDTGRVDFV